MTIDQISSLILDVPNFPKPGIMFKDITPILENPNAFLNLAQQMTERIDKNTEKLMAIESRGFILGAAVAQHLKCGLVLLRKPGKLPRSTHKQSYDLEYGTDSLEMHQDALKKGDKVTIIDDVLATGGTAGAAERLCEKAGATVLGSIYLMEIGFLKGRQKLKNPVSSMIRI